MAFDNNISALMWQIVGRYSKLHKFNFPPCIQQEINALAEHFNNVVIKDVKLDVRQDNNTVTLIFKFTREDDTVFSEEISFTIPDASFAIDSITSTGVDSVSVDNDGVVVVEQADVVANSQVKHITTTNIIPIVGSEDVVVDKDEDRETFHIHLDGGIRSNIDRALKTPLLTPTETKLVSVDSTNSQVMLSVGEGLSVEDNTLKANSTSNKVYRYTCILSAGEASAGTGRTFSSGNVVTTIYSTQDIEISSSLTTEQILSLFFQNTQGFHMVYGFLQSTTDGFTYLPCNARLQSLGSTSLIIYYILIPTNLSTNVQTANITVSRTASWNVLKGEI